jgi:hypothetical protein
MLVSLNERCRCSSQLSPFTAVTTCACPENDSTKRIAAADPNDRSMIPIFRPLDTVAFHEGVAFLKIAMSSSKP